MFKLSVTNKYDKSAAKSFMGNETTVSGDFPPLWFLEITWDMFEKAPIH